LRRRLAESSPSQVIHKQGACEILVFFTFWWWCLCMQSSAQDLLSLKFHSTIVMPSSRRHPGACQKVTRPGSALDQLSCSKASTRNRAKYNIFKYWFF
jgi:hypothetical protein